MSDWTQVIASIEQSLEEALASIPLDDSQSGASTVEERSPQKAASLDLDRWIATAEQQALEAEAALAEAAQGIEAWLKAAGALAKS